MSPWYFPACVAAFCAGAAYLLHDRNHTVAGALMIFFAAWAALIALRIP